MRPSAIFESRVKYSRTREKTESEKNYLSIKCIFSQRINCWKDKRGRYRWNGKITDHIWLFRLG